MVVLAAGAVAAGCGGDSEPPPDLDVAAATSLREAFSAYADSFDAARVRLLFAGSEALAEGIRAGERPDVFAAAEAESPERLFAEGLVEEPVLFAANELVVGVPRRSPRIARVTDLARAGVTIAVAGARVSLGQYTDVVLDRLDAGLRDAIQGNVVERPPDVGAVVETVAAGRVDAGFMYLSDVRASRGRLRALTPALQAAAVRALQGRGGPRDRSGGRSARVRGGSARRRGPRRLPSCGFSRPLSASG